MDRQYATDTARAEAVKWTPKWILRTTGSSGTSKTNGMGEMGLRMSNYGHSLKASERQRDSIVN